MINYLDDWNTIWNLINHWHNIHIKVENVDISTKIPIEHWHGRS